MKWGCMYIEEWQWDDGNREELARHGVTSRIVYQVWQEAPHYRKNAKKHRAASHQMIGPDKGGRMWLICIKRVSRPLNLWRAVTGWSAEQEDVDWYWRN